MPGPDSIDNEFLNRITDIILENISDEKFGVSELAREAGMSRSNLLRKVKQLTKTSASQFIRQVRLKKAMEMLKQTSFNVSEVSYRVGFGSTSYFIKCFHEYYGYPPGRVGSRDQDSNDEFSKKRKRKQNFLIITGLVLSLLVIATLIYIIVKPLSNNKSIHDRSIAILPFRNESNDSTNVYLVNGLMESTLTDLQKIKDLRVVSRTSVEKYRNLSKTLPEIAKELNVTYIVEGSGQKIGDQILLNIQLIDGRSDKHLWGKQYKRKADDIFSLQMEIARNIADEIEAVITPEEDARIKKAPTENVEAYDYFLQGLDLFYRNNLPDVERAIVYFRKAVDTDPEFALAYADIAISYYLLDVNQLEKKYQDQINYFSDKALLLDDQLPQSLVSKALFYINNQQYELAVPFLEKALEYNPNSALVINILSDFYARVMPDTEKYLGYALKGVKIDIAANDSISASFIFLHLSNAFIQSGFIDEAELYIDKSLAYYPANLYSEYVKAYILYARDRNLEQTKELLIKALAKDSTRIDILQETAKICYFMRDYESSWKYYSRFIQYIEDQSLNVYYSEYAKIAYVMAKMGQEEEAEKYLAAFKEYSENDRSIYKHINLAVYYSYKGETQNALEQMKLFSQQDNYHYWIILFLKIEPLMDNIKDLPGFNRIYDDIVSKFWKHHDRIKASLEEQGLL